MIQCNWVIQCFRCIAKSFIITCTSLNALLLTCAVNSWQEECVRIPSAFNKTNTKADSSKNTTPCLFRNTPWNCKYTMYLLLHRRAIKRFGKCLDSFLASPRFDFLHSTGTLSPSFKVYPFVLILPYFYPIVMQRWLHVRVCGYGELKAVFYGYVNVGSSVLWLCGCWKQCSMGMWMLEAVRVYLLNLRYLLHKTVAIINVRCSTPK